MAPTDKNDVKPPKLSQVRDMIDQGTFEQILEMDDDDDCDFSKGIVYGFFDQAKATFTKIETALEQKDLNELSQLGHFLKGSSATLGLIHVRDGCEKIQHFGNGYDESGSTKVADEVALKDIEKTLREVEVEYAKVEKWLRRFYGEEAKDEPEPKPEAKEEKKTASDIKETKSTEKTDKTEEKPKVDDSKK